MQISRQLDALSHFHFTPRPVVADTKLKTLQPSASAVASLMLEDITPVTVLGGNASQLAPEQVQAKKHGKDGAMMAEEEMTSEDRKRKRRASKAANKAKKTRAADEAMYTDKQAAGPGAAAARARAEARTLDEELKRDSRVTLTTGSQTGKKGGAGATAPSSTSGSANTSFSKSSSFFNKLQQETSDNIKKKAAQKGGKAPVVNPFTKSVNSLKL
jgi:U3 small nucleolar RNA-associated protein MPP10